MTVMCNVLCMGVGMCGIYNDLIGATHVHVRTNTRTLYIHTYIACAFTNSD